jgi:4-amino-4-deoxy-L-arabinose transferase-like glycosyltransferase
MDQLDGHGHLGIIAPRTNDAESSTGEAPGAKVQDKQRMARRVLLGLAMVTGALTHGIHLFMYPLYITDEGIYMERAWSVIREGALSPYTYYYDHAPAGWLTLAAWIAILPRQFETFGNAINTGRVLMLIVHVASVFLLFQTTYRLSHRTVAAVIATFLFNFSPLAVFYQRMVLLDNLMVFWVLLSLYLATSSKRHVLMPLLSGLALGIGILTKENAIFFIPGIAYLVYRYVRPRRSYRFAIGFWIYSAIASVSLYLLLGTLKNELLPTDFDFNLNNPPQGHVSLLFEVWYQLHRNQGSILNAQSTVYQFSLGTWLPKDPFILIFGSIATIVTLVLGFRNRSRDPGTFVAALLAAGYAFYLVRGSVMLVFYVVPLVPFYAMCIGVLGSRLLDQSLGSSSQRLRSAVAQAAIVATCFAVLLLPVGGYVLVHNSAGSIVPHDLYKLPQNFMEEEQVAFIRQHIPPHACIVMDDDIWVDLHDVQPYYTCAVSHWNASGDPAIYDKVFDHQNWQSIDYIVMSNQMLTAMQQNGPGEDYILTALSHATRIWDIKRGNVELSVYQVQK